MNFFTFFITIIIFNFLSITLPAFAEPVTSASGKFIFDNDISINVPTSLTNTAQLKLDADIRIPINTDGISKRYPAIIFITSWGNALPENNTVADNFADKGYVILTYTPRGFRGSEGFVDTGSNLDINDGKKVIDWLIANHPVNPDAIGLTGLSYGGGIAYAIATQDARIRAIVARSSWTNLLESFAPNLTGRIDWPLGLFISGKINGKLSASTDKNFINILTQTNITETVAWGNERSPILHWDAVNNYKNPPAIYLISAQSDYLFGPSNNVNLFKKHQGPKRFDLQYGTHVVSGFLEKDEISKNLVAWFDHYLNGEKNGIQCLKPINYVVNSSSFFKPPQESINSFDDPLEYFSTTYYLTTNNNLNSGQLTMSLHNQGTQTLSYNTETAELSSGFFLEQVIGHRNFNLEEIDTSNALVFKGPVLNQGMKFRGSAKLSLNVLAESSSQYFVYLVEVNPQTNIASWVSHAPYSAIPRDGSSYVGSQSKTINIETFWTTHDVQPGNYLALIIDSKDPGYVKSENLPDTSTIVISDMTQSTLSFQSLKSFSPLVTLENAARQQLNCADDNPTDINLGTINRSVTGGASSKLSVSDKKSGASNLFFWLALLASLIITRRQLVFFGSKITFL